MPAIFVGIIGWLANSWLGKLVIGTVIDKLSAWAKDLLAKRAERKRIKEEAEKSVQALKDAKTGNEIDAATDSTLDGF